tara:strand:- start:248 stop:430 length:183 start_codon:yes stop_codon:yes gene_type:complete
MKTLVILLAVVVSGCSMDVSAKGDAFWIKKLEPRTVMPWYSSAGGDSNPHGFPPMKKGGF